MFLRSSHRRAPLALRPLGLTLLALTLLALAACEVSGSIGAPRDPHPRRPHRPGFDAGFNTPAVGLSPDGLGFAVRALAFSSEQTYGPMVYTPGIGVGVAVWGYGGGTAVVEVRDATGHVVLVQRITSNIAQGNAAARGVPPFTVRLAFHRFTGDFSLGVGAGDDW